MDKLHLYKLASPLNKSGHLQQGKLQGVEDGLDLAPQNCSEHEERKEPQYRPKSTETTVPKQSLCLSGEHSHSLSLSDSGDEDDGFPQQLRFTVEQKPPACTISSHDESGDTQVLLIDADTSKGKENLETTALKVTSMRVPSPVKVVPHFRLDEKIPEESQDWRRFSTNFVNPRTTMESSSKQDELDPEATAGPIVRQEEMSTQGSTSLSVPLQQVAKLASLSSTKRKKGKVVPSRYLTGNSKVSQSSQAKSSSSSSIVTGRKPPSSKSRPSRISTKSDTKTSTRDGFKIPTGNPRVNRSLVKDSLVQKASSQSKYVASTSSSTNTAILLEDFSDTPVVSAPGMSTSTPCQQAAEGPVTHDGSFMNNFAKSTPVVKRKTLSTVSRTTTNKGFHMSATEMEVEYSRLIQLTYLDIMSYKALRQQESNAKEQIYQLWRALQEKKDEIFVINRQLEEEERNLNLDKALDVQVDCLGPVCSRLSLLEQNYMTMALAVDATRHDVMLKEILPIKRENIEAELTESELCLAEINAKIRERLPKVINFSSSSKVIAELLDKEYHQLNRCYDELSQLIRTQMKCTSLQFEQLHRIP